MYRIVPHFPTVMLKRREDISSFRKFSIQSPPLLLCQPFSGSPIKAKALNLRTLVGRRRTNIARISTSVYVRKGEKDRNVRVCLVSSYFCDSYGKKGT